MSQIYEQTLLSYFEPFKFLMQSLPLNLGGISASGGGEGGPPGGFIGMLPQTRISYDYTEAEIITSGESFLVSGESLLDNLNKIRYRVKTIENLIDSGEIGGTISIEDDGVEIDPAVTIVDFRDNLKVTGTAEGEVSVKVVGITDGSIPFVGSGEDNEFAEDNDNLYYDVVNQFLASRKLQVGRRVQIAPATSHIVHIVGEDDALASVFVQSFGVGTSYYPLINMAGARGNASSPSPTISGDILAAIVGRGFGENDYSAGSRGRFYIKAYEDWTDSYHGTKAEIQVTPQNSDTPEIVVIFTTDGILFNKTISVPTLIVNNNTLTVPATGTAALLETANIFTNNQKINCNSATALFVEQDGVFDNTFVVNTTTGKVGIGTATPRQRLEVVTAGLAAAETGGDFENPSTTSWANIVFDFLVAGTTKGSITVFRNGVTSAGLMSFRPTNSSGSTVRVLDVGPTELTINEDGLSTVDLRVETDSYNAIFVDASNESIVIMNNTAGKLGFHGATAVIQQVLATGASHTVDDVITFLQLIGLCKQT